MQVKLNRQGFAELRNSPGVMDDLTDRAYRIGDAAGDGFDVREAVPGTSGRAPRARASVGTTDFDSIRRQAYHHILESALDAGRD